MKHLWRFMVLVTVLGIALTIYLTIVHYAGLKPACTAGQSCIKVQTSQWSEVKGIPVALIGLIGYIAIFVSLVIPDREEVRLATLGMTLIGFGFSVYLTYREGHSIHAYCEECLTSAAFMTILLVCSIVRYLKSPMFTEPLPAAPVPLPPRGAKRASGDSPARPRGKTRA